MEYDLLLDMKIPTYSVPPNLFNEKILTSLLSILTEKVIWHKYCFLKYFYFVKALKSHFNN